jgi:hypothetical protein
LLTSFTAIADFKTPVAGFHTPATTTPITAQTPANSNTETPRFLNIALIPLPSLADAWLHRAKMKPRWKSALEVAKL